MTAKRIIKPWLIVGLLLVIPTSLFTAIELLQLNDQEEVIETIYAKQLESVLYSINQYADDLSNVWINELYQHLDLSEHQSTFSSTDHLQPQAGLFILHPIDSLSLNLNNFHIENDTLSAEIVEQLKLNQNEIAQLQRYSKSGYRKLIGIDLDYNEHTSMMVFVTEHEGRQFLNLIILDAFRYIQEVLSPRLQMVAGDNLIIVVTHQKTQKVIASSLLNTVPDQVVKEQSIWWLPDYVLGIQPQGISISDLAQKRASQNISLLLLVDVLLIFGAWLFYRNVKRELHLAKVKSDFVSNVSHEIRTPLALISMYTETLQLGRLKEESKRQKYYSIIFRETQRLSGIVNNILNFSKIESGRQKLNSSSSYINEIVETVANNYDYHLKEKGFDLTLKLDDQLDFITIDHQAITECIINLLDNAIKYSAETKQIGIATGQTSTHQFVEITDKGIGISAKDQKHIFDKFYRVTKGALAHHAKGSGLGLSIVMHLVNAHKGKIEVSSKEGQGSTFRILLPTTPIKQKT